LVSGDEGERAQNNKEERRKKKEVLLKTLIDLKKQVKRK
jgi:hypothetical protein